MNRDDIIRMARTAEEYLRARYGAYRGHYEWRALEEAFNAGAAAEREACAKVCDELADDAAKEQDFHVIFACESCGSAIRERNQG